MENHKPPIRIISPGRVYRAEATDTRHETTFHQIEALAVDTDITLGHLKGAINNVFGELFGPSIKTRLRGETF